MSASTLVIWAALLDFSSAGATTPTLVVAGVAALVQLTYAHRAHGAALAATRTYESSALWIAAAVAVAAALLAERVLLADVATWAIIAAAFVSALVHAIAQEVRSVRRNTGPANQPRAVIIGTGEEAAEWFGLASDQPATGVHLVGCIGDRCSATRVGIEAHWLGPISDLEAIMEREDIEVPIVAVTSFRRPALHDVIDRLSAAGHDIAMWWGVGRVSAARLSWRTMNHEAMPMIRAHGSSRLEAITKRTLDLVVSVLLLAVFGPLLAVVAIAVRLDSTGPAFFRQRRVGLDGRPFEMIKLRTMKVNAEDDLGKLINKNERGQGVLFKMALDPRVTRIGHFLRSTSIDELPQLFNVVRGEMSLVGPRPALISETAKFDEELARRNTVRPGITGLWQLESRANPSFAAYKRLDLHYLENWSFGFDLRIAVATAQLLVLGGIVHPIVRRLSKPTVQPETTLHAVEPAPLPVALTIDLTADLELGPEITPTVVRTRLGAGVGAGYARMTESSN